MPTPLVITLPAADEELSDEIEQRLAPHAEVMRPPPAAFDLETIKLVVEIITLSVGAVAGTAVAATEVIKNVLEIKEKLKPTGQASAITVGAPDKPGKPLADVDEAYLRELLGVE